MLMKAIVIMQLVTLIVVILAHSTASQVPENIIAGSISPTSAFISWDAISNAPSSAQYWYRRLRPSMTSWKSQTETSVTLNKLDSATPYIYQVQYCRSGETRCTHSQNVRFRTLPSENEDGHMDKALPTVGRVGIRTFPNYVNVSWDRPKNDSWFGTYKGYMITWCKGVRCQNGPKSFKYIASNSTQIEGLDDNTPYTIQVQTTYNSYFGPSQDTTVHTSVGIVKPVTAALSTTSIMLLWTHLPSFQSKAKYWLRISNQSWVSTNESKYVFEGLTPWKTYKIEMQYCVDGSNRCGQSVTVNATTECPTPLQSIKDLRVKENATNTLIVGWSKGDCDQYNILTCDITNDCITSSTVTSDIRLTGLLDYSMYNVTVWCVKDDRRGPRSSVVGYTNMSSVLENLRHNATTSQIMLSWKPKRRPLATNPRIWIYHPVFDRWINTTESYMTISNLTSATTYNIEIQYCTKGINKCAASYIYRARTKPGDGEGLTLDKSIPDTNYINVTGRSTSELNVTWSAVPNVTFYALNIQRCDTRSCPLYGRIETNSTHANIDRLEDLMAYNITVLAVREMQGDRYFSSNGKKIEAVTAPGMLTNMRATSLWNTIVLRWDAKQSNVPFEYQYRRNTTSTWSRTSSSDVAIFNDLYPNSTYTFQARFCARHTENCSPISQVSTVF